MAIVSRVGVAMVGPVGKLVSECLEKSIPGGGNSSSEVPEVGASLIRSKNITEASVRECSEQEGVSERGDETGNRGA